MWIILDKTDCIAKLKQLLRDINTCRLLGADQNINVENGINIVLKLQDI